MNSVRIISVDLERIRRAVDDYARGLFEKHPEVEEVVVFGSFSKNNYAPGSDVDMLIILSHSDLRVRERIPDLLPDSFPTGVDLFPYTREELASLSPGFRQEMEGSIWRYLRPANL